MPSASLACSYSTRWLHGTPSARYQDGWHIHYVCVCVYIYTYIYIINVPYIYVYTYMCSYTTRRLHGTPSHQLGASYQDEWHI